MIDITDEKLNEMCENFEEMKFKAGAWWPTIEEIKNNIEPNLDEMLEFAIWITETADEPKTDEEKEARSYLLRLINSNLNFVD